MDETRRSLIKGMLTGGTLLALGIPTVTQAMSISQALSDNARNCQLLLGNTLIDEAFASGAQAACVSYIHQHQSALPAFKLEGELLTTPLRIVDLLTQSRNMRWIAVMDYASAAIFTELVRNFEGHLLSLGSHSSSSGSDATSPMRHTWTTAMPAYSAGELLASILAQNQHSFSIVENFLKQAAEESAIRSPSLAGFASYQSTEEPTARLHCLGVSPQEANRLIGWDTSKNWESSISQAAEFFTSPDKAVRDSAIKFPQFDNWIEATGYAIVATALGMGIHQEPCSSSAFVHRSEYRNPQFQELSGKHFVSFVIDV